MIGGGANDMVAQGVTSRKAKGAVFVGADPQTVTFADGAFKRSLSRTDFAKYWNGIAVLVRDRPFSSGWIPWAVPLVVTLIGVAAAAVVFRKRAGVAGKPGKGVGADADAT